MGSWLKINGEAVYGSKPWKFQNDTRTAGVWYTQKSEQNLIQVYAIVLEYPYDTNEIHLFSFSESIPITEVQLLGMKNTKIMVYFG